MGGWKRRSTLALLVGGLSLASYDARAQEVDLTALRKPEWRQGYYLGGGLRTGIVGTFNDEIDPGTFFGPGVAFRFGEMVLPWLGFGGLAQFYFAGNEDFTTFMGSGAIEAQFEPLPQKNLALRFATGPFFQTLTRVDEAQALEDEPDQGYGVLVSLGPSLDLFPLRSSPLESGGLAITLFVDAQAWLSGDFNSVGAFAGVEIGHYFGLGKNKLDLPVDEAFNDES